MTPADYDDALDAHARAHAALSRAADDESHALALYKSAAERKAKASELEQTLRRRLHGMLAGRGPAAIPEPQKDAARVPCRVCGTHPCSCAPPDGPLVPCADFAPAATAHEAPADEDEAPAARPKRARKKKEPAPTPAPTADGWRPAEVEAWGTADGLLQRDRERAAVLCVRIVCTREGWCNVDDPAHVGALTGAMGGDGGAREPLCFPFAYLSARLKQLADAGLNAEVLPPPKGHDDDVTGELQVRRAVEAPGLAGRVVVLPAPPAEPREPPLSPCEPGEDSFGTPAGGELFPAEPRTSTAQKEGR